MLARNLKRGGPEIVFVGHTASRSGSPLVLLSFLRWLHSTSALPFHTVLAEGGTLEPSFESLSELFVMEKELQGSWTIGQLADRLPRIRKYVRRMRERRFRRRALPSSTKLVYCNSVASGVALATLRPRGIPVVAHIHELDTVIRDYYREFCFIKAHATMYLAASEAVKSILIDVHRIPSALIRIQREFLPTIEDRAAPAGATTVERTRDDLEQLGIPREAPLVGSCGTANWRKGADIFLAVATRVASLCPDEKPHFLWIGNVPKKQELRLLYDRDRSGVATFVHYLGEREDVSTILDALDVFLLPSREDPYPLVMLEAARARKPIVYFDKAGGMTEFLGNEGGVSVPYLDFEAMASAVARLVREPALRRTLGRSGFERLTNRHYVDGAGPEILGIIERCIEYGDQRNLRKV